MGRKSSFTSFLCLRRWKMPDKHSNKSVRTKTEIWDDGCPELWNSNAQNNAYFVRAIYSLFLIQRVPYSVKKKIAGHAALLFTEDK